MMEKGILPFRRMLENKCRSNRIFLKNHHFATLCVIYDLDKDPHRR